MRKLIIALTAFMLLGLVSKAQDKPIIDIGGEWNLEQGTDAKGVTYDKVLITQNIVLFVERISVIQTFVHESKFFGNTYILLSKFHKKKHRRV